MIEFHEVWIDQCEAARDIKDRWGVEKALGYLVGEKLVNFIRASDTHPEFAAELPAFVEEVQQIFEPQEIRGYLDGVRRIGPLGHVSSDEEYEELRAAGAVEDDPVNMAEDILVLERVKRLLLP